MLVLEDLMRLQEVQEADGNVSSREVGSIRSTPEGWIYVTCESDSGLFSPYQGQIVSSI